MLTMLGSRRRCCDGITRRETLRAGGLILAGGLSLSNLLRLEEARGAMKRPGKAKSVIMLYLLGGAPTQDMFDLKPDAPTGIRSEFKPIATSAPGVSITEMLPSMARWMHRGAIVRGLNHKAGCHNPLPSYTGDERQLPDIITTSDTYPPSMGSVVEYLHGGGTGLPAYMYLPCYLGWGQSIRRPGPYAGFLGKRFDPLFTECVPTIDKPPETPYQSQTVRGLPFIPGTKPVDGLTIDRLNTRKGLLAQVDEAVRSAESSEDLDLYERNRRRAFDLLTSAKAKAAFDVESEDPRLIDRYGRTLFGQSCLIARRLVEAGVRFVNVTWDCYWERCQVDYVCWDTHARNFPLLKEHHLPLLDQTFTALMEDLEAHGLLDETLVVVTTDMGRTPRVNANGGRDHWTYCYANSLFGAGIRGGTVFGASDAQAAYVKDHPVRPADVCATIFECLGIDPETTVNDQNDRPVTIASGGQPIREILA